MFKQCRLQRGDTFQVAWLPEKIAKVGLRIKLKVNGVWDKNWRVLSASQPKSREFVLARSRDWKNQRKVSDL